MFLALLTLRDLAESAERALISRLYVQGTNSSTNQGGIITGNATQVLITGTPGPDAPIYVARVEVEYLDMLVNHEPRQAAQAARSLQAQELIRMYLAQVTGAQIGKGILLQPGMLGELPKIETTQHLWRWSGRRGDPDSRELVAIWPRAEPPADSSDEPPAEPPA